MTSRPASTHLNYGGLYGPPSDYGEGVYRRGLRLKGRPGEVLAELEDTHHAMRVRIQHDGARVLDVEGETVRIPTTACPAAVGALKRLIGADLATPSIQRYRGGVARSQCTHLFDLTVLAIAHATRGDVTRRYDVIVPDDNGEGNDAIILLDGVVRHQWRMRDQVISSPAALAGQALLKGFIPWAVTHFEGDDLEAALILQMGVFVAQARRKDFAPVTGRSIAANLDMHDRCFAYQPDQREAARHIDSGRDLTNRPQDVLAFTR